MSIIQSNKTAWDITTIKPMDNRYVIVTTENGEETKAQYIDINSIFRAERNFVNENRKFVGTRKNPIVHWREI